MIIYTFEELIEYLQSDEVLKEMVIDIACQGLNVIIIEDLEVESYSKDHCIKLLIDWWSKWKDNSERPLFIF